MSDARFGYVYSEVVGMYYVYCGVWVSILLHKFEVLDHPKA